MIKLIINGLNIGYLKLTKNLAMKTAAIYKIQYLLLCYY